MMSYVYGSTPAAVPQTYQTQQTADLASQTAFYQSDALLDDLSQLAAASALRRRHSRGSTGYRTPGSAMRIVKPTSANNSPRSSALMQARRRTTVNDSNMLLSRQPSQSNQTASQFTAQDYMLVQQQQQQQYHMQTRNFEMATRPPRPVSWHPGSSHLAPPSQVPLSLATAQFQVSAYATPVTDFEPFPSMHSYTLSPAAYSIQTSPSTAFSPYLGAFDSSAAGHYYSPNPWAMSPSVNTNGAMFDKLPSPVDCPALVAEQGQGQQMHATSHVAQEQSLMYKHIQTQQQPLPQAHCLSDVDASGEWNMFATHGFNRSTAPPTPPHNCYVASQVSPAQVPSTTEVSCPPLEEDESDGEILFGMGLYDPPEKEVTDPTLQSYRSSVANLLGSTYKYPEPTGKGLKLEDAWEPPEDMDDDDQDEDCDADAEEQ